MSKVVILWINFSSSTSYPNGPVDSGMSLYCADVVNAEINKSYPLCDCKQLCNQVIQVELNKVENASNMICSGLVKIR